MCDIVGVDVDVVAVAIGVAVVDLLPQGDAPSHSTHHLELVVGQTAPLTISVGPWAFHRIEILEAVERQISLLPLFLSPV